MILVYGVDFFIFNKTNIETKMQNLSLPMRTILMTGPKLFGLK